MDVPTALNMGITVALGPDWTASGTMNQLAEMSVPSVCQRNILVVELRTRTSFAWSLTAQRKPLVWVT